MIGYKPIKQIHKIPYGWARQLSPFIKQIQSPPEAVIKFWSSPGKWRFTCNISQKIYSVISSFPLWSPVTSSEISHNRCYMLQPLMTALPSLWRFFQLLQQMDTFNRLCLKNIYIQNKNKHHHKTVYIAYYSITVWTPRCAKTYVRLSWTVRNLVRTFTFDMTFPWGKHVFTFVIRKLPSNYSRIKIHLKSHKLKQTLYLTKIRLISLA